MRRSDVQRISKPEPDRAIPTNVVNDPERGTDDRMVAAVTTSQSTPDQLETLLLRLLAGPAVLASPPKPEPPTVEQLLQRLLAGAQARKPAPPGSVVELRPKNPGGGEAQIMASRDVAIGHGRWPSLRHSRY